MFYGLISGAGWALSTVLMKHRPIPVPVSVVTGWQLFLASLPIVAGALLLGDHAWFMPSATSWLTWAYIMLIPMLFGNLLWFLLIGWLPPKLVSLSPISDSDGGHALGRHRPGRTAGLAAVAGHGAVGLRLGLMLFRGRGTQRTAPTK